MTRGYGGRFGFRRAVPMEHSLPPPRVSGLRKGVGIFYEYLCFFGLVCGSPPSVRLVIQPRQAPSDVLSYTAAENAVRWRNLAAPHGVGVDKSFPTRPSPVDAVAVSAALLVACRACALSLGADGLTAKPSADGTPVGLVIEGLSPCAASDGFATAAATMATRAVWTRVPRWAGNRLEADQDAAAMDRAVQAALSPVSGVPGWPSSRRAAPPSVGQAAIAAPPVLDTDEDCLGGGAEMGPPGPAEPARGGVCGGLALSTSPSRSTSPSPVLSGPLASSPSVRKTPSCETASWTESLSSSFVPSESSSLPPRHTRRRPKKRAAKVDSGRDGVSSATAGRGRRFRGKELPVHRPTAAKESGGKPDAPYIVQRPRRSERRVPSTASRAPAVASGAGDGDLALDTPHRGARRRHGRSDGKARKSVENPASSSAAGRPSKRRRA